MSCRDEPFSTTLCLENFNSIEEIDNKMDEPTDDEFDEYKIIVMMMVRMEEQRDLPLIPWVKEGMKNEMKRETRDKVKKEMKEGIHTF